MAGRKRLSFMKLSALKDLQVRRKLPSASATPKNWLNPDNWLPAKLPYPTKLPPWLNPFLRHSTPPASYTPFQSHSLSPKRSSDRHLQDLIPPSMLDLFIPSSYTQSPPDTLLHWLDHFIKDLSPSIGVNKLREYFHFTWETFSLHPSSDRL